MDELKRAAAQSIHRRDTDVKDHAKLAEGGFNRVLQITMTDDTQLLARLPYPLTEPRQMAVASEVATLALLRAHGLPVPRVLAYSTDARNPVGTEYIIMEKIPGSPLGNTWFDLSEKQRLKVLLQIVQLEAKFHAIEFPGCGSVYYARDLPPNSPRIAISDSDFCIGPDVALKWWFAERAALPINRGPCKYLVYTRSFLFLPCASYKSYRCSPKPRSERARLATCVWPAALPISACVSRVYEIQTLPS